MPRLWSESIEAHRASVRDALLDATARLVAEHGLASVTMSQVAKTAGVGRATLYKYFPDLISILLAWHERQVSTHVQHLVAIRDRAGEAGERVEAVLEGYALSAYEDHGSETAALLHRGAHLAHAQDRLHELIADLLSEAAATGAVRSDVAASELATYCLHALSAAATLRSKAAVRRLVAVTLAGLTPPS